MKVGSSIPQTLGDKAWTDDVGGSVGGTSPRTGMFPDADGLRPPTSREREMAKKFKNPS